MADWFRKQEECQKCGRLISVCSDPEAVWYPQRTICYADAETAAARRIYEDLHGENSQRRFHDGREQVWSEKRSALTPFAYDDGVHIWAAAEDINPDDKFLSGGE